MNLFHVKDFETLQQRKKNKDLVQKIWGIANAKTKIIFLG